MAQAIWFLIRALFILFSIFNVLFKFVVLSLQPTGSGGGNALLPSDGISAAAGLFALIVESELKGKSMWENCGLSLSLFLLSLPNSFNV